MRGLEEWYFFGTDDSGENREDELDHAEYVLLCAALGFELRDNAW